VGVFINQISNKLLIDLDYSDLDHTYNATNVQDSWGAVYTGTTTSGGLLNGAILYPFAHIGYIYDVNSDVIKTGNNSSPLLELNGAVGSITNNTTPMKTTGFKPAIQIRQVLERIFQQNGYDVESNFFDEEYFQRLYLPLLFNSENYYIVAPDGTDGTSQVTTINDAPPDGFNFTLGTYYTIQAYVVWDEYVYNNGPAESSGYGWGYNGKFIPWVGGNYTFDWSLKLAIPSNYNPSITQIAGSVYLYKNRTTKYGEVSFVTYPPDSFDIVSNFNQVIPLLPGDYLELVIEFIQANPNTYSSFEVVNPIITSRVSTATVTDAPNLVIGSTVIVRDQFTDEYKQLDFLKGLITQFNLVFVKHPYKTNTYIMEPYNDYVAKGDVLDWTDKLDKSKSIEI
jgi:hypothetical protein